MDNKRDEDGPLSILDITDRKLVEERLARADPAVRRFVLEVFDAADPDERFTELAKAYIGNQGEDTRSACVTYMAWAFGAQRPALKKLLRWKSVVGVND